MNCTNKFSTSILSLSIYKIFTWQNCPSTKYGYCQHLGSQIIIVVQFGNSCVHVPSTVSRKLLFCLAHPGYNQRFQFIFSCLCKIFPKWNCVNCSKAWFSLPWLFVGSCLPIFKALRTIYEPPPENHFCIFTHDGLPSLPRQPWLTVHPLFFSFCRGRNIERKVFFVGGWVCRRDQFFTSVLVTFGWV